MRYVREQLPWRSWSVKTSPSEASCCFAAAHAVNLAAQTGEEVHVARNGLSEKLRKLAAQCRQVVLHVEHIKRRRVQRSAGPKLAVPRVHKCLSHKIGQPVPGGALLLPSDEHRYAVQPQQILRRRRDLCILWAVLRGLVAHCLRLGCRAQPFVHLPKLVQLLFHVRQRVLHRRDLVQACPVLLRELVFGAQTAWATSSLRMTEDCRCLSHCLGCSVGRSSGTSAGVRFQPPKAGDCCRRTVWGRPAKAHPHSRVASPTILASQPPVSRAFVCPASRVGGPGDAVSTTTSSQEAAPRERCPGCCRTARCRTTRYLP